MFHFGEKKKVGLIKRWIRNGSYTSKNVGRTYLYNWNHSAIYKRKLSVIFQRKWNTEEEEKNTNTYICSVSLDVSGLSARTEHGRYGQSQDKPLNGGPCFISHFNNLGRNHIHVLKDNLVLISMTYYQSILKNVLIARKNNFIFI